MKRVAIESSAMSISTRRVNRAGAITPVPGGVGPMTIACLLLNTLNAAIRSTPGAGDVLSPFEA